MAPLVIVAGKNTPSGAVDHRWSTPSSRAVCHAPRVTTATESGAVARGRSGSGSDDKVVSVVGGSRTGPIAVVANRSPRLTSARCAVPWGPPNLRQTGDHPSLPVACAVRSRDGNNRRGSTDAVDAFLTLISGISTRTFQWFSVVNCMLPSGGVRGVTQCLGDASPISEHPPSDFRHVEVASLSVKDHRTASVVSATPPTGPCNPATSGFPSRAASRTAPIGAEGFAHGIAGRGGAPGSGSFEIYPLSPLIYLAFPRYTAGC